MIKLKLLAFSLMLLGPCAFLNVRRGWRMARALPAALCAQSLLLIFMGYLLPFSVSTGVLAAVSAAAWAYALVHAGSLKKAINSFLIPTVIVFACAVFLYDACSRRLYLSYDEYSHWGLLVKVIHEFDALPRAGLGAAYVQFTYPPATAMLPSLSCTILGYREGVAYFGYAVLIGGLLAGLAARAGSRKGFAPFAALIYLCVMAVFPLSILRLFVEPVIALLMALLILGALEEKERCSWEGALYAAMLAMTKNTGLVFVLLALIIRICARPERREVKAAAGMMLAGALAAASYQIYCRVQGIEAVISPSHFAENLQALLAGTLSEDYLSLPARFAEFFLSSPLPQSGVYSAYGFGTSAAVFALMLLMSAAHISVACDRRQALRLWGGVWLMNALYMAMIVAAYFFSFEPEEVARLAEADRYSMLVALWTGVLACALLAREKDTPHPKRRMALLCLLAAVLLPLSHTEMTVKTFVTCEYADNTHWAREDTGEMAALIEEQLGGQRDVKLLCMGGYEYVELHYALVGIADIGPITKSWENAPWSGSAQSVREELKRGGYDYVFVGDAQDGDLAIDGRYAILTAQGEALSARTLYRVELGADGSVYLAETAAVPEQET